MKRNRKLLVGTGLLIASSLIIPYQTKASSDFGTISIANPNNPDEGFTIMDRNLGATSNDITSTNSYGYYFQRGNNHGFPSNKGPEKISADRVDASKYGPGNYYENDTYIIWNENWDLSDNNNLWGGKNDNADNGRGMDLKNPIDRQGPCPNGYHIPSLGEWLLLTKYWADNNNKTYNYYPERGVLELNQGYSEFRKYFKIPLAGEYYTSGSSDVLESNYRNYISGNDYEYDSVLIRSQGHQSNPSSRYRSSSPSTTSTKSRDFYMDDIFYFYIGNTDGRTQSSSIRCFKNTYEPEISKDTNNSPKEYAAEIVDSYVRAYEKGIISESPIDDANLYDALTNSSTEKILLNYANYLGLDSNLSTKSFGNLFNTKNSKTNRAIFGTALSRILWGDKYDGGSPYYKNHLNALKAAGIMNQIDNPESKTEIKGYVLIMLKNSINKYEPRNEEKTVSYSEEFVDVYNWAYKNGIISESSIEDANLYDALTNSALKNILLNYAKYLGIDSNSATTLFGDLFNTESSKANRAIFGTALSRILWGNKYDGGSPYYKNHLNALKTAGIMNQIDNPESKTEIKGYVLIMLKNSINNKTKTIEATTEKSEQEKNKTTEVITPENNNTTTPAQTFTYKQREESNGNSSDILQNGYSREMNNAYNFAHTNGLTTSSNIDKAKMNSPLTRIAMAKILSNYAINILGKQPDTSKGTKNFNDVTAKQNADYDNAVTLSYQLGIMGQGTNKFRPNDEVTRAEFATALSRMLYSTPDGKDNYYSTHLNKLKQEGIISNDNPKAKEKRGYVMLMLMRTVK